MRNARTGIAALTLALLSASLAWTGRASAVPSFPGAEGFGAMGFREGIEVGFTDAAGRHWRRSIGGPLQELPDSAIITYGFCYPIGDTAPAVKRRWTLYFSLVLKNVFQMLRQLIYGVWKRSH